jgi:hypothetical protein
METERSLPFVQAPSSVNQIGPSEPAAILQGPLAGMGQLELGKTFGC